MGAGRTEDRTIMHDEGFADALARVAHDLWLAHMKAEGWTPGQRYDEAARTHDALVPFENLDPRDRRCLLAGVRAEGLEELLLRAVDYPRGAERELGVGEMRRGLTVTDGGGEARGSVESWETDAGGRLLELIRVRWEDGEVTEHYPPEGELRIVG